MQVCRAWRSATDLPYVWRRLCLRKRLLLDGEEDSEEGHEDEGEEEGEEDGEEQMVQEEMEEQIQEPGCDDSAFPRRLSFWARLYKTRSAVK